MLLDCEEFVNDCPKFRIWTVEKSTRVLTLFHARTNAKGIECVLAKPHARNGFRVANNLLDASVSYYQFHVITIARSAC